MISYSNRVRRARRLDRIARNIEIPFRRDIKTLKNKFIDDQLLNWQRTGALSQELLHSLMSDMDQVLHKHWADAIQKTYHETVDQTPLPKHAKRPEIKASKWEYYLQKYATAQGGKLAKTIAQTTYNDLNTLIVSAFNAGYDETDVIRNGLRAKGYSNFRADTIARTETHNASTYAADETISDMATEVGITMMKAWQPVVDDRTRPDHLAMDGTPAIRLDDTFDVGGTSMDRPGDPSAPSEQVINCRCVLIYEAVM